MCFVWRNGQIGNPHPTVADSFPGLHQACLQVLIPLLTVMERTWHCRNGKKEQLWTDSPNFWTTLLLCRNTSLYMLELARSSLYVKVVDQRATQASSPCKLTYTDYNRQGIPSVLHSNKRKRQRNWGHIQLHFLASQPQKKQQRFKSLPQLPILWYKSDHESSLQKSNLKKTTTQQDITWPCLQKHQELHFSKESSCHHHPGQHGRQMKKLLELLQDTATRISHCLPQVCKTMLPPRPGI